MENKPQRLNQYQLPVLHRPVNAILEKCHRTPMLQTRFLNWWKPKLKTISVCLNFHGAFLVSGSLRKAGAKLIKIPDAAPSPSAPKALCQDTKL